MAEEKTVLFVAKDSRNYVEELSQLLESDERCKSLDKKVARNRSEGFMEIEKMQGGVVYLAKSRIEEGDSKEKDLEDAYKIINDFYKSGKIAEVEKRDLTNDKEFISAVDVGLYARKKDLSVILGDYSAFSEKAIFEGMGIKVLNALEGDCFKQYQVILDTLGIAIHS